MGDRKKKRSQKWQEVRSARLSLKDYCCSRAKDTWMVSSFLPLSFLKDFFFFFWESCTQPCCLYCEVQPLYYQASGDLILLNEVID